MPTVLSLDNVISYSPGDVPVIPKVFSTLAPRSLTRGHLTSWPLAGNADFVLPPTSNNSTYISHGGLYGMVDTVDETPEIADGCMDG